MSLRDSFSLRRQPRDLFELLLHLPVSLCRGRLGSLFGERVLLIALGAEWR